MECALSKDEREGLTLSLKVGGDRNPERVDEELRFLRYRRCEPHSGILIETRHEMLSELLRTLLLKNAPQVLKPWDECGRQTTLGHPD